MDKTIYIDYLRQYIESYIRNMFKMELNEANLEKIFQYSGNERHQYPLYFIWVLPEFRQWYIDNNKACYMLLGENFAKHMIDLFYYNSYILDDLLKFMVIPDDIVNENLTLAKISLGDKIIHLLEGSQKFLWSFISKLESVKKDIGVAL